MKANTIDVVERQIQAIDHATTPDGLIPASLAKSLVQEQADTIERLRALLKEVEPFINKVQLSPTGLEAVFHLKNAIADETAMITAAEGLE